MKGVAVVPEGIVRGGAAFGSMVKAYSHFCLAGLSYAARLMKRVIVEVSGPSSFEMWKNGSRS